MKNEVNRAPNIGAKKHKFSSFLTHKGRWFLATLTLLFTLSIGQMWGANGDVLFTQNFSGTGSLTYTQNVALTKTSGLAGIVGNNTNLFTSITTSNKNSTGIAINHATAGGSLNSATGIFQAYFNNTSGYWSAIRTNDLAGTAPTAIKFSMDIWFNGLGSSSSACLVNVAVGDGFTEALKSSSPEATDLVHSGWGVTVESSPKLCAYNAYGTKIYNTALSYSKWYSITWVINNTGESLTYDNPTGTGTSTLANDKYDIWLKETSQEASSYTKVASAVSATTADKVLQELYFGHAAGKKHEFRLDNLVITDLTPAAATTYSVTYSAGDGAVKSGKSLPTQAAVAAGTEITLASAENLELDGKEFDGWLCSKNSTKYAAGAKYTMTADATTFTAQWRNPAPKYTVTYSLNGASGDAPTETDKAAGDAFNLAAAPSWAGHAFDGWLCSADAAVKAAGSSYTMTAANTTFTAQWHEVDCKIYSLTGGIGSAEVTASDATVNDGESLILSNTSGRIKLTPATGETFKSGDVITISGFPNNTAKKFSAYVYAANGSTKLATLTVANAGDLPLLSGTLSGNADYVYLARIDGTTQNILTCEIHRSCAEGTAAGLSYATASVEKATGDAAFTNPLTNTNSLVVAGYGTSDASVATVAANGQVTVVGDGTATITAYSAVQMKGSTLYAAGTATYTVTVTSASDDATLSALSVNGLTLSPTFASATENYTVTKEYGAADPVVGDVTATPTSGEANAAVVWDSENHKFVITVTAGDNTTKKTYNITVNEAPAPKNLSRVLFSNGFDAFIDNTNHTVKAYYLAGTAVPTATTITAGAGTAGEYAEGKITVTGADASSVDYTVTLAEVTPNTTTVAAEAAAGEFAGDEAWVKNGLLIYGNAAGYDGADGKKWYVNRRLTKSGDAADDQRVIAGWVRSYFFVGNASKFIMTVGGNNALKYSIDGGDQVANASGTLEIPLTAGNHMIEVVSNQQSGDCRLSAPKLVEIPPTYSVTYKAGAGSGSDVVDATEYAAGEEVTVMANSFTAPANHKFSSWASSPSVTISAGKFTMPASDVVLTAQWREYFTITYMDGETILDTEDVFAGESPVGIADPVKFANEFAGWTLGGSDAVIDVTDLSASTTVYAKWIAFDGCTLFYPATSGSTIAVGDEIASQTGSFGATMVAVSKDESCTLAYDSYGLSFAQSGNTSRVKVTLDHEIAIGTKITVTLVANGDKGSNRALDLYNSAVAKKAMLGWASTDDYAKYDVATFSHVVTADDAMAGTNEFYLYRNNSVYLQCLKVESCGAAIVYHNVTSEVNIAGKGTVTLGASSVREGYTTTATYSDIDPLYEFVSWSVSGEGATLSSTTANPVTVTMGTADAVVTLNLQVKPVYYTVTYYDGASEMGTEEVAENGHPTATGIVTKKLGKNFLGWSETDGGAVVNLEDITITAVKNLYAKYETIDCPTSGTVYKFEIKDGLASENLPISTNRDMSSYIDATGEGLLTYTSTQNNKAVINDNGTIQMKDEAAYLKVELACTLAAGDQIRAHVTNNPMRVQVGTTYNSNKDLILDKNAYDIVDITSDMVGKKVLYITRSSNGNANLADFEIYRRPALTGVTMDDMRLKIGKTGTPVLHLLPADDAIVTSQAWAITASTATGTTINASTGLITAGGTAGEMTVQVTLNGDKVASATVAIVQGFEAVVPVTATTTWDWTPVSTTSEGPTISAPDTVLANYISGAGWENLAGNVGAYVYRSTDYKAFQGTKLSFKAAVPGKLRMYAGRISNDQKVYVNGIEVGKVTSTKGYLNEIVVPAGNVYITAGTNGMRIYNMTFDTNLVPAEAEESFLGGYERTVNPQYYGTICLPKAGVMTGALLFRVSYMDYKEDNVTPYKVYYDQVENGTMEAGMPYIFLAEQSTIGVYYTGTATETAQDHNGLHGTLVNITEGMDAEGRYMLYNNQVLHSTNAASNLPANRAYLQIEEIPGYSNPNYQAPAPKFRRISTGFNAPQIATGIDAVETSDAPRKIMIDGTMYILRGEKMYDATGRLVK